MIYVCVYIVRVCVYKYIYIYIYIYIYMKCLVHTKLSINASSYDSLWVPNIFLFIHSFIQHMLFPTMCQAPCEVLGCRTE